MSEAIDVQREEEDFQPWDGEEEVLPGGGEVWVGP